MLKNSAVSTAEEISDETSGAFHQVCRRIRSKIAMSSNCAIRNAEPDATAILGSAKTSDNTTPAAMACVRVVQLRPNHLKPSPHSRHKPANRNAAHFAAAQPIVTPNVTGLNKNLGYERNGSETPDFFATQHAIIELTANSRIVDLAR